MYNYQKCPSLSQIQYFVHHRFLFISSNEYSMKHNYILSLFVKFEMLAVWNFPADLFRSVKSWRIGPVPTGVHAIFPNSWMEKKKNPETNILIVSVFKAYWLSFYAWLVKWHTHIDLEFRIIERYCLICFTFIHEIWIVNIVVNWFSFLCFDV